MSRGRPGKAPGRSADRLRRTDLKRMLAAASKSGRHAHRNHTLILLCYRHGLRLRELAELRWKMVDLQRKILRVPRFGGGPTPAHSLGGTELTALRKLRRDYPGSSYLFVTDRGAHLSEKGVSRVIAAAGRNAGLNFTVTAKMVRYACGYALAEAGRNPLTIQHYLGYQDPKYVLKFFDLPAPPIDGIWRGLKDVA